jgi:hypothetical protein
MTIAARRLHASSILGIFSFLCFTPGTHPVEAGAARKRFPFLGIGLPRRLFTRRMLT